ncbi:hypothetical protein D777_03040 [Marinobacter nitratireducens]|uniref:Uncharacterized protein n=1 Tax=Marinobacter nitratireducens TaxID=1137280 RepID=A0A072MWQ5_9GAMM|nr:hypothetical protein D777_03040 [Marinobacter nitratireducens]
MNRHPEGNRSQMTPQTIFYAVNDCHRGQSARAMEKDI